MTVYAERAVNVDPNIMQATAAACLYTSTWELHALGLARNPSER